jgi:hypothetical protein
MVNGKWQPVWSLGLGVRFFTIDYLLYPKPAAMTNNYLAT